MSLTVVVLALWELRGLDTHALCIYPLKGRYSTPKRCRYILVCIQDVWLSEPLRGGSLGRLFGRSTNKWASNWYIDGQYVVPELYVISTAKLECVLINYAWFDRPYILRTSPPPAMRRFAETGDERLLDASWGEIDTVEAYFPVSVITPPFWNFICRRWSKFIVDKTFVLCRHVSKRRWLFFLSICPVPRLLLKKLLPGTRLVLS